MLGVCQLVLMLNLVFAAAGRLKAPVIFSSNHTDVFVSYRFQSVVVVLFVSLVCSDKPSTS